MQPQAAADTSGALCHVARRNGCSRGRLLHSWGAFFGLVQRKRPRPRKEIRLLPYPTTTQPHSQVPYPTGQNGHAFPRNPARQTLATWAYVAATMLCCSTFHARDVEDVAPYKAFARHSRGKLTTRQRYAKRFCTCQRSTFLLPMQRHASAWEPKSKEMGWNGPAAACGCKKANPRGFCV